MSEAAGGAAGERAVNSALLRFGEDIHDTFNNLHETLGSAGNTIEKVGQAIDNADTTLSGVYLAVGSAQWCLKAVSIVSGLSGVATAGCTLYKTISGAAANDHLVKLGHTISTELRDTNGSIETLVTSYEPSKIASHVWHLLRRRHKEANQDNPSQPISNYFFIYHPGTNWHSEFYKYIEDFPLPAGFCGVTHRIDVLAHFLVGFRKRIGSRATIHVLVPSAHMYVIPDSLDIPAALMPLRIEGELGRNGKPLVYITGDVDQGHVKYVSLLANPKAKRGTVKPENVAERDEPTITESLGDVAGGTIIFSLLGLVFGGVHGALVGACLARPLAASDIIAPKNRKAKHVSGCLKE